MRKALIKKILVIFKKNIEETLEGNKKRGNDRVVPDYAMERMIGKWEDPDNETKQLYDEIIFINNHFEAPHVKNEFHYK